MTDTIDESAAPAATRREAREAALAAKAAAEEKRRAAAEAHAAAAQVSTAAKEHKKSAKEADRDAARASREAAAKAARARREAAAEARELARTNAKAEKVRARAESAQAKAHAREERAAAKQAAKDRKRTERVELREAAATAKRERKESIDVPAKGKKPAKSGGKVRYGSGATGTAREVEERRHRDRLEKKKARVKGKKSKGSKPKPIDITNAIRSLATVLDASSGELEPVRAIAEEFEGTQIGDAFWRIYYRMLDESATLVEAFTPETVFPPVVLNMLKVGEKTISPGNSLRTAVSLMDTNDDTKRKLKNELMEPISVGLLSLASLVGTAWFVMPSFTQMYEALEMPIPAVSQAVLTMSEWVVYIVAFFGGAAFAGGLYWTVAGRKNDRLRTWIDAFKLRMPLMGKANQAQQTYQTLNILTSYLSVGASETEALIDTAAASENRAIRRHLEDTAEALLQGTRTFAEVLDSPLFPSLARRILTTGQRSGQTKEALKDLTGIYKREADVEITQGVAKVVNSVTGVSTLVFVTVVTMVTIPPLEMFTATLNYNG